MDIESHWRAVKKAYGQAVRGSLFACVATVREDGSPHTTPIGSLILLEPCRGLFFEEYPRSLRANLDRDPRLCVMAVRTGMFFWLKALIRGRFDAPPGVRLYGRASQRRAATEEEKAMWQKRVRFARGLKGHDILWRHMKTVRDVDFDRFEPVEAGPMTRGLWPS